MNAARQLATQAEHPAPAALSEPTSIMAVIARAAADPNTDVEKLGHLLSMYERIAAQSAKVAYNAALAVMQPKLPIITERGEIRNNVGKVQSTYAKWEDINEAIKPILAEHGFGLSFRTGRTTEGMPEVTGVLSHEAGHSEETSLALPVDSSGSKNSVQGVGSTVSYGKRYTAGALLNLTSRGEDDDGKAAGDRIPAGVSAANASINLCTTEADLNEWKAKNGEGIKSLPADQADAVIRLFKARIRAIRAASGEAQ